jgi:predicted nucleic acid-binding protein
MSEGKMKRTNLFIDQGLLKQVMRASLKDARRQASVTDHTIRSSTDCLIAAIAIQNDVPVWHKDRDFTVIAKFTRLRVYHWPGLTLL